MNKFVKKILKGEIMEKKLFEGVYSAIFSVYDENLNVKKDTVGKLVDYQLNNGLHGFYVGGNTGECTVLPAKTRKQMLEAVVEANDGRGQIMAHIGAGHYDEVMDLVEHANGLKVDAIASLPPALQSYYGHKETVNYYKALAKASKYPVYAYVTPVTMQHSDLYEFAKELSEIDNIAGLKVTIPDYFKFSLINRIADGKLNNLNGPDEMLICGLSIGAQGGIGSTYNILPRMVSGIYENFKKGNMKEALEYQNKLNTFIKIVLNERSGMPRWKACMSILGFDMGHTVFPAIDYSESEIKELKVKLDNIGFFDMV